MVGAERAGRLRRIFHGSIVDAYTENCGRFSDDLGDNSITFAFSVIHNLRHMLEEGLRDEPGIAVTRPQNSFQVEIDHRVAIHFYKSGSGPGDIGEIRFDESKKKLQLIADNSAQLALFSADEELLGVPESPHLIVVHSGTPTLGLIGAWIGAPHLSAIAGPTWLWRERLHDGESLAKQVAPTAPVGVSETALPELIVELRDGDARPGANEAS